jgi:DNA N6-methyl adenine demethylase
MIKINEGEILKPKETSEKLNTCTCKGIRICNICEEKKIKLNIVKNEEQYDFIIDLTHLLKIKEFSENEIKEFYLDFNELQSNFELIDFNQIKLSIFEEIKKLSQEINFQTNNLTFNSNNFFEGFKLIKNFVNDEESKEIIQEVNSHGWVNSQSGRKKQDFGPKINYKKRKVKFIDGVENFPTYYDRILCNKINNYLPDFSTAEIGNLWYSPVLGSSIDPHIDDYWIWGRIIGINFLSKTVMTFSKEFLLETKNNFNNENKQLDDSNQPDNFMNKILFEINFPIDPEDAYIMTGSSRYLWKHSIKRKNILAERVVITLREYESEFKIKNKTK